MIVCEGLDLQQGSFRLHGISLAVPAGGYGVLMGRTGCGKTSLVEAICGLRPISAGRIAIGGLDVTRLPPGRRGLGYVPQDGALFPTMDVAAHLGFGPRVHGWGEAAIRARVDELAEALGIAHLRNRAIQGLSGGERQRVALGRALAARPRALLLDEPLSAVDETTRGEMITLLRALRQSEGVTVLHVTHSRHEADQLADPLLTCEDGAVRPGMP